MLTYGKIGVRGCAGTLVGSMRSSRLSEAIGESMGDVKEELIDLVRAIARGDWATVAQLWSALDGPAGEVVLNAAFGIAVNRRFEPGGREEITSFVRELRSEYETEDAKISQAEAEAMIRMALGEEDLADEIDWGKSGASTFMIVLGKLLADARPSDDDLEKYLHDVRALAAPHLA